MAWIILPTGMTSAVVKDGKYQIRARDRASLTDLFDASRIVTGAGTDYPFRVYSTPEEYSSLVAERLVAISYSNFKNEAKRVRGKEYAAVLASIWSSLLRLEPKDAKSYLNPLTSWRLPKPAASGSRSKRMDESWESYDAWEDRHATDPEDLPLHMLTDEQWNQLEADGKI